MHRGHDVTAVPRLAFAPDGESQPMWLGDADLQSPDGRHVVMLRYAGEPPHGANFYEGQIDGVPVPGFFWAGALGFSADSRFFIGGWMPARYARKTIVVDMAARRCLVLPLYLRSFAFHWPLLQGVGADTDTAYTGVDDALTFTLRSDAAWTAY
ncbi:hypothetical protein [Luteimonas sp. TWI1437]|uniref:hypothetical protein n=1 Tax=unclassified Luteimonas TaxID=2629088 RepID=UPI00320B4D8A